MNIGWNIETYISVFSLVFTVILSYCIIKINWRKYGLIFILSAIIGVLLCYLFIYFDLYSFPYRLFPQVSRIPFTLILTIFPFYVLIGVRYSPRSWKFKIPFYWGIVHFGVLTEAWAENCTQLIKYNSVWDLWDSYTWWWIFLLIFEWIGSLILPENIRKPIDEKMMRYGGLGWFILHFTLISTIFLAGAYAGKTLLK